MSESGANLADALLRSHEQEAVSMLAKNLTLAQTTIADLGSSQREFQPLHVAALLGLGDVACFLLQAGVPADTREVTHKGWSALHFAAQHEQPDIVEWLLLAGATLDIVDADGRTPLHFCALNDCPAVARKLLIAGARVDVEDHYQSTPQDYAFRNRHHAVMALLESDL